MIYDTAGKPIYEPTWTCDCGLTGGCEKCNPRPSFIGCISDKEAEEMKNRIDEWKKRFNESFERRAEMLKHYGNN